jgi:hypothetical protein
VILRYDRLGVEIPECRPHMERGSHLTLYRFTPEDYRDLLAVFAARHAAQVAPRWPIH